jgi:ActR/RegA family two-component response regulator
MPTKIGRVASRPRSRSPVSRNGKGRHPARARATQQRGGLTRVVHLDRDQAEHPAVQARSPTQASDVVDVVGIVADERGGRIGDDYLAGAHRHGLAVIADQDVGQHVECDPHLVVAVVRAFDDRGVGAEGHVVDEDALGHHAEVHVKFDAVGQRIEALGGIAAVQPEVEREMVAGAGRDDQQRHVVLGGNRCDQAAAAVSAGDTQQICAPSIASRASAAISHLCGPSRSTTVAPRRSASSRRCNRWTFPPPDRGFMMKNGCRGGGTVNSG